MSVSKWAYTPEVCDGGGCPGDCDLCDKPKNMEDEDDTTDYIKREDAVAYPLSWEHYDKKNGNRHFIAGVESYREYIESIPSADVRDDATAHKVVGGGERDGSTCWFECSNCHAMVDINDKYCSECGARFKA